MKLDILYVEINQAAECVMCRNWPSC